MAPRPSRARAPPFMNERRVQWQSTGLSPLEFRRAQDEGRELVDISIRRRASRRRLPVVGSGADDLRIVELSGEHSARLRPRLSLEQRGEEGVQDLRGLLAVGGADGAADVDLNARDAVLREGKREVEPVEQRARIYPGLRHVRIARGRLLLIEG